MKDKKGFGNRIKVLRELRGLTIEEAAERSDSSESIWRQYERGERMPSLARLKQICLALHQKPEYFFGPELDSLLGGLDGTETVKAKIDRLQPDDLEIVDALVTKCLELRNQ